MPDPHSNAALERAERAYPERLRQEEAEAIRQRRKAVREEAERPGEALSATTGAEPARVSEKATVRRRKKPAKDAALPAEDTPVSESNPLENAVGLAISGGGIRSATFSLGVLQALARKSLLRQIDLLSTVSGGSYIGAFWGRHYLRQPEFQAHDQARKRPSGTPLVQRVEDYIQDRWSHPCYWLRQNGRYLAPNGAGDVLVAGAAGLRDWLSLHFVVGVFALLLFFTDHFFRALFHTGFGICHGMMYTKELLFGSLSTPVPPVPVGPDCGVAFCDRLHWLSVYTGKPVLVFGLIFLALGVVYWLVLAAFKCAYIWRNNVATELREKQFRRGVTRIMGCTLLTAAFVVVYRIVDLAGLHLYHYCHQDKLGTEIAALGASLAGVGGALRYFSGMLLSPDRKKEGLLKHSELLVTAGGLLLLLFLFVLLSALSYWFTDTSCPGCEHLVAIDGYRALWLAGLAFGLSCIFGYMTGFLNYTSLHALYASRITRAYLGASNPRRWNPESLGVTEPLGNDDVRMLEYRPHVHGGPLHIINATLNETASGQSQIEQRDRKGLPVAVSAIAMSVGVSHHATVAGKPSSLKTDLTPIAPPPGNRFRIFEGTAPIKCESMSLGEWVGISGAAVSTGMGARTSLGLSTILAFLNIRVGYWWDSGINPKVRLHRHQNGHVGAALEKLGRVFCWAFRTQSYLIDEFLGRFHGPARQLWHLTDGGHYENTGVYELVRRQVPLIICIDNGADPQYHFEDLGNLVRRVRTDFGADIRFVDADTKKRILAGLAASAGQASAVMDAVRKGVQEAPCCKQNGSACAVPCIAPSDKCHLHLGHIRYDDTGKEGLLLWVKPLVSGDEDHDVIEYCGSHPLFPQESTLDQFFDEAQWESYRRLGEHSGTKLAEIVGCLLPLT